MSNEFVQATPAPAEAGQFRTTRWSLVLRAADTADAASREALERLCETYLFCLS